MAADRPQRLFLLRGSALLISWLVLWWFFLVNVLMAILEIVLVMWFMEITAHKVAAQLCSEQRQAASWLLRFSEYLAVNVIPYAAPFLIAIALHRELRWQMFRWGSAEAVPVAE